MQILIIGHHCPALSACIQLLYQEAGGAEILYPEQRDSQRLDLEFEKHLIELHHLEMGFIDCLPGDDARDHIPTLRQLRQDHRKPQPSAAVRKWQIDHQVRCQRYAPR